MGLMFILFAIGIRCAWGAATYSIIKNKGYDENWFWLGFILGLLGVIIAFCKSENYHYYSYMDQDDSLHNAYSSMEREKNYKKDVINNNGWVCSCGRDNASYVGTCACGKTKSDNDSKANQEHNSSYNKYDEVKRLKELLDMQAITQDEYDKKKKELLGL